MMSPQSRRTAGLILLIYPIVALLGLFLLQMLSHGVLLGKPLEELQKDFYRLGYGHAGLLLVLSLVMLRYVDDALLNDRAKMIVRLSAPIAALLVSFGFFLAYFPGAQAGPNGLIYLVVAGVLVLITGFIILGVGLMRR